jgi:hypothetical protein
MPRKGKAIIIESGPVVDGVETGPGERGYQQMHMMKNLSGMIKMF